MGTPLSGEQRGTALAVALAALLGLLLGEALDYARQGELAAARWKSPVKAAAAPAPGTKKP